MGFAPTWLRQVSPASQNHFNHWCVLMCTGNVLNTRWVWYKAKCIQLVVLNTCWEWYKAKYIHNWLYCAAVDLPFICTFERDNCGMTGLAGNFSWTERKLTHGFARRSVVKVRGAGGGAQSPCSHLSPPAIVWAPLIESIKCYFMRK